MKIQLNREVQFEGQTFQGGTNLTPDDMPVGSLNSLVQTGWAVQLKEKPRAKKVVDDTDDSDQNATNLIADLKISKNAIAALRKQGIETVEQAKAYIAEHGSLEPISGVTKEVADKIAAL